MASSNLARATHSPPQKSRAIRSPSAKGPAPQGAAQALEESPRRAFGPKRMMDSAERHLVLIKGTMDESGKEAPKPKGETQKRNKASPSRKKLRSKPGNSLPPSILDLAYRVKNPQRSYGQAWALVEEHLDEIPLWAHSKGLMWVGPKHRADVIAEATCTVFISALKFDEARGVRFSTFAQAELRKVTPYIYRMVDSAYVPVGARDWASRYRKSKRKRPENPEAHIIEEWGASKELAQDAWIKSWLAARVRRGIDGHDLFNGTDSDDGPAWRKKRASPSSVRLTGENPDLQPVFEDMHDLSRISGRLKEILSLCLTGPQKAIMLMRLNTNEDGKALSYKEIGRRIGEERRIQPWSKQYVGWEYKNALSNLASSKYRDELRGLLRDIPQ